jgi:hypothetical protein
MAFFKKKSGNKAVNVSVNPSIDHQSTTFIEDWSKILIPHEGQKEMEHAFFELNKKYIFNRRGRKGAKSTDNIRIAWRYANEKANRTIYICCPQIIHAAEIYWDERRLQRCDADDDRMFEKYVKYEDKSKYTLHFNNGSFIKLIGTWTETRARGQQPDLIIFDEVQDCRPDYIEAMDSNLAAKPDARCIMSGTPPKKYNHFQEWEQRIAANPDGICFKHSSYINTALPHLKDWLDKKKAELYAVGKEDTWLREYMAEDSFASEDRMLPDPQICDYIELIEKYKLKESLNLIPVVCMLVTEAQICIVWAVIERLRHHPMKMYVIEAQNVKKIWNTSFLRLNQMIEEKCQEFGAAFKFRWNKVIWDETDSFTDVVQGWQKSRKDFKWKVRGIPLLKELMLTEHMLFSNRTPGIGVECQNYLRDEEIIDYPTVSAVCVLANEFYQAPTMSKRDQEAWDKYQPLREAGLIPPLPSHRRDRVRLFSKGDFLR